MGLLALSEEVPQTFHVEKVKSWPTFVDAIIPVLSVFNQAAQPHTLVDLAKLVSAIGHKPSWAFDALRDLHSLLSGSSPNADINLTMKAGLSEGDHSPVKVSLVGLGSVLWPVFLNIVSV